MLVRFQTEMKKLGTPSYQQIGEHPAANRHVTVFLTIGSLFVASMFWKAFADPLVFYVTAFFTAPGVIWIVSEDWIPSSPLRSRIAICLLAVMSLLSYRWIFQPYSPDDILDTSAVPLPNCGANLKEITAVYTWVNVSDSKWQKLSDKYDCDTTRYKSVLGDNDPFDVLRYSMRSVATNFPYITKFLIVTERDQSPHWLNRSDQSVQVVFHDEYMPEGTYPVFNSHPIEYTLYLLRKRGFVDSNCFLYLNDDFLINKPISMDSIVSKGGKIVFNTVSHVDFGINSFIDVPFGAWDPFKSFIVDPHVPYVINTAAFASFMEHCGFLCEAPMRNKCVRKGPFPMEQYQTFMVRFHPYLLEVVPPIYGFTMRFPIGAGDMPAWMNRLLISILNPPFVYLSSHGGLEDDQGFVDMVRAYFNQNFFNAGSWELLSP